MTPNSLRDALRNFFTTMGHPGQADATALPDPYKHVRDEPPTLAELVHRAAESGGLAAVLPELPPSVADALRAIAGGERASISLEPVEIAQLGQAVAIWGIPSGRGELAPGSSALTAREIVERLDLPLETAQRIAAVVDWPIGFEPNDIREFAALTAEDTERVMVYLADAHGTYTKGTRYAAP